MSAGFDAVYYDGRSSREWPVRVEVAAGRVRVAGAEVAAEYALGELRVQPRVASLPVRIELPGGAALLADADAVAAALPGSRPASLAHRLESHLGAVAFGIVGIVAIVWAAHAWGVPWLARELAYRIPPSVEAGIAEEGMDALDRLFFEPTRLPPGRQGAVRELFTTLARDAGEVAPNARLEFRAGGPVGANALAIPGGVVVLTDELVELFPDDDRLAAVIAHELGHLEHRHGARHILQDTIVGLVTLALFGDASAVAALAATVPAVLVHTGYSRDFEREADRFAYEALARGGRSPRLMGEALAALEAEARGREAARRDERPKSRADFPERPEPAGDADDGLAAGYLSTHPATSERIRDAEAAAAAARR